MSGFDDDLGGEVGREAWYVLRGRWLGISPDVVAQEPGSFERQGKLADALRALRADREESPQLQDLPTDERRSIKDCLDATARPFPLLRRPVPLPQAVQCAEELWAEASASDPRASATKLIESARVGTQDIVNRTREYGSSLARWGSGIFGAASGGLSPGGGTASEGATPTHGGGSAAAGAAPAPPSLRASLRARGGICGPSAIQASEVVHEPIFDRAALPESEVLFDSGVAEAGGLGGQAAPDAAKGPEAHPEGDAEGAVPGDERHAE